MFGSAFAGDIAWVSQINGGELTFGLCDPLFFIDKRPVKHVWNMTGRFI